MGGGVKLIETMSQNMQFFFLTASLGRRQKKRIADFQTFAQIGVGGSGKNLI